MKMTSVLTLVALVVGAFACGSHQAGERSDPIVRGHYVWGAEVNSFSPCGSTSVYWVDAAPSIVQALRDQYMAFELPPYSPVFVEVRGEVGPVLDCGFCESYDGSFKVEELVQMESPGPESCVTGMVNTSDENGA